MKNPIKVTYEGGRGEYNIPFPYLDPAFVQARVDGGTERLLTYGVEYTVHASILKIHTNTAPTDFVTIYRQTATDRLVVFHDGAVLREADLTMLQLQLLHTIEEHGDFTITSVTQDITPLQLERTIKLAPGVTCERGTILGYKAGGFVIASNQDYTTLQDTVLALDVPISGKVKALSMGQYGTTKLMDGNTCFVGARGEVVDTPPLTSGSYIKIVGVMEGDTLMFKPDAIALQLA